MTTYRLFPATNGPATPVSFGSGTYGSGNLLSAVVFAVAGGGNWFNGYWWWVCATGQNPAGVKCALWSATSASTGTLVPGSVITSGALTAGQWNYIPLSAPIQLAPSYDPSNSKHGSAYIAAIGCNGNFPDSANWWHANATSGIVQGPLVGYSGSADSLGAPYSLVQGIFSTGGSDPSTTMPIQSSGTDNFWVDVQVSTTAPAGYTGSYRMYYGKADANGSIVGDSAVDYVVGAETHLTAGCTLNSMHFYSQSGASGLPTRADVWSVSTQTSVASITSPAWLTEAGAAASAGAGWVKAAFAASTTLPAGTYRVTVYNSNGTAGSWNPTDSTTAYYITGAGGSGLTNGPLYVPNQASAQSATFYPGSGTGTTGGQPVFAYSGTDVYPTFTTGNNPGQWYPVDLEVTPLPSGSGLLMSGII